MVDTVMTQLEICSTNKKVGLFLLKKLIFDKQLQNVRLMGLKTHIRR